MASSGAALNLLGWLAGSSVSTVSAVMARSLDLLLAPARYTEMLWIVLPLLAMMVAMELYFSVYADESLGWNSATANSLFLALISLDLLRQLFSIVPFSLDGMLMERGLFTIAGTLLVLGIVLFILNFKHALPQKIAFSFSSVLPVNLFAYFSVVVVYSHLSIGREGIPLDALTGIAAVALFLAAATLFGLVHLAVRRGRFP